MIRRPEGPNEPPRVEKISTPTTIFVLIVIGLVLYAIQWILLPFVIAGLIAFICTPLVDWLNARTRLPRSAVVTGVFLVIVAAVALTAWSAVPPLVREVRRVVTDFHPTMQTLAQDAIGDRPINLLGRSINAAQIADAAVSGVHEWLSRPDRIALIGGLAFSGVFAVLLVLVLLFYFLIGGPTIARGLLWMIPPKQRPLVGLVWSRLDPVLRRYFVGIVAVVVYATLAAYIGLGLALGIHHAVVLALVTGVLEIIPMVGPAAAIAITGLVAVRQAVGIGPIIGYAIYVTLLRLSIDQLFGPLALGAAARIHPTLIIFAFLSGGILFGITGVIMAVPVAVTIKVTLATLYDDPATGRAGRSAGP